MSYLGNDDIRTLNIIQIIRGILGGGLQRAIKKISTKGGAEVWHKVDSYLRLARVNRVNRKYDKRNNVDTWSSLSPSQMETDSVNRKHAEIYTPMPERIFRFILNSIDLDFREYTFVDYGSGKGKALLMASDFQFRKIIGVEFAKNLHRIADRNISNYKSEKQKCFNIETFLEDASRFLLPESNCIIFLYAPFHGPVLDEVLENVKQWLIDYCRRVVICYVDDDVLETMVEKVDTTIEEWGLLTRHEIGELLQDKSAFIPMIGTFWKSRN